jgi:quercetin dioxygenase-like cupin family protein
MEFERSKVFSLQGCIDYSGGAIVSMTPVKKETGNITLFSFEKGQSLSEHSTPFDAFVLVTEGEGQIKIGGKIYEVNEGEFIIMPANIPHAVIAAEKFKMMLVMIKS